MTDATADAAKRNTQTAARKTADSARDTVDSARETVDNARETGGAAKTQLKQSVDEIRAEVGREVGARAQQARDWAEDRADQIRTTVTEKPFASAGAAFAAGVILGVLLARR